MMHKPGALARRLRSRRERPEEGSLILDILIGMAIFALIAIIAVSAVGQYRERAYKQGAMSDATALGIAVEAQFIDSNAYPGSIDVTGGRFIATYLDATTVDLGAATRDMAVSDLVNGGETIAFCVEHKNGPWSVYDSAQGGIAGSDTDGSCAAEGYPGITHDTSNPTPETGTPPLVPTPEPTPEPTPPPAQGPLACPTVTVKVTSLGDVGNPQFETRVDWALVPDATEYRVYGRNPGPNRDGILVDVRDAGQTSWTMMDMYGSPWFQYRVFALDGDRASVDCAWHDTPATT